MTIKLTSKSCYCILLRLQTEKIPIAKSVKHLTQYLQPRKKSTYHVPAVGCETAKTQNQLRFRPCL